MAKVVDPVAFVSLDGQEPLSAAEHERARDASAFVRALLDQREDYVARHALNREVWMPAANWEPGQRFYNGARELLAGNAGTIELLRIYAQQFSGYALWCMSKGTGTPLPPLNRQTIAASLNSVTEDTEALATYRLLRNELPEYLRIGPPIKFGEVGWRHDGMVVNYDVAAYWERLLLLYRFGFLNRASPRALRAGSRVLEIGPGYGALAWYIQEAVPGVSYTVLDLPESLVYAAIYLGVLHPGATRVLANYEFPTLVQDGERFDLVINTLSMSEMSGPQVRSYCEGIGSLIGDGGAFFEQNQDNRSVGMLNAQDIIAGHLQQEGPAQRMIQGYAHVWTSRGRKRSPSVRAKAARWLGWCRRNVQCLASATVLMSIALLALSPAAAQPEPTALVRERVAAYVQRFVDDLTNVVAEERYVQQFRVAADRRRLRSDFLLVKYPGDERRYQTFRDVLEVDGRPVRDQQARITQLFLEPFASAVKRAGDIEAASFRQSLRRGRLVDPLQAIANLQAFYQPQFEFSVASADRRAGADLIELTFTQITPAGVSLVPLRGKALLVEQTGRVIRTELTAGSGANVRVTTTEFGFNAALRIDVPVRLRDEVPAGAGDTFIGTAEYTNFRRFQVSAEQEINVPAKPEQ